MLLFRQLGRNEVYQEEMWSKTIEFLKDHLSPETVEKYGPPPEPAEVPGRKVEDGVASEGETESGEVVTATEKSAEAKEEGDTAAKPAPVESPVPEVDIGRQIEGGGKELPSDT